MRWMVVARSWLALFQVVCLLLIIWVKSMSWNERGLMWVVNLRLMAHTHTCLALMAIKQNWHVGFHEWVLVSQPLFSTTIKLVLWKLFCPTSILLRNCFELLTCTRVFRNRIETIKPYEPSHLVDPVEGLHHRGIRLDHPPATLLQSLARLK